MLTPRPAACSCSETAPRLRYRSSSSAPVMMMSSMMHLVFCSLQWTVHVDCSLPDGECLGNSERETVESEEPSVRTQHQH